jgi:DNA-binding NarL/FixJ family response regulator
MCPRETRSRRALRDGTVRTMSHGRVLLADSHLCLLQGVHSLLESVFAAVVMVADQGSLLETIERLDPDLVVIDLSMPVQDGTNVVRQLIDRFPGIRVIALSVHDEPTVANQIRKEGVAGFVLKRTAATDLIPAVEAVLGGGSFVSPAVWD